MADADPAGVKADIYPPMWRPRSDGDADQLRALAINDWYGAGVLRALDVPGYKLPELTGVPLYCPRGAAENQYMAGVRDGRQLREHIAPDATRG
jgi:hypothetical protein